MQAAILAILMLLSVTPAFAEPTGAMPSVSDPDFVVERFASGIPGSPTTMAFVGDDIIALQKHDGQVRLVHDGQVQLIPLLDKNVDNTGEQGMLGIAAKGSTVYLYFSESEADGQPAVARRVYKYDWTGSALANEVLVRDMNSTRNYHNGGGMAVGPDGTVYLAVGDTGRYGQLQNLGGELYPDTSSIIPVAPEGPYYAVGVRNSFGIAFDPVTGSMWETENGDDSFDEINLVEPYMNSGWYGVMGPANSTALGQMVGYQNYTYSDPEFSWEQPVAPTGLAFVQSEPLAELGDSLFVGDCNTGSLYRFVMNEDRDGFSLSGGLADGVADRGDSQDQIIFGAGFGCVTDVEMGPDGLLYIVSLSEGTIFRLVPEGFAQRTAAWVNVGAWLYLLVAAIIAIPAAVYFVRRRRQPDVKPSAG